jgi:capsular polysaccharide biosynthesis protein
MGSRFRKIANLFADVIGDSHKSFNVDNLTNKANRQFTVQRIDGIDYITPDAWNQGFWGDVNVPHKSVLKTDVTGDLKRFDEVPSLPKVQLKELEQTLEAIYENVSVPGQLLQYFKDVAYVIHKHSTSDRLNENYNAFLKNINKKVEQFEERLYEALVAKGVDIDDVYSEETLKVVTDKLDLPEYSDLKDNLETLLNLRRTVASTQLTNGYKTITHDFATKELFDHMTKSMSEKDSYKFLEQMYDVNAIVSDNDSRDEILGDVLASKPNGTNTLAFQNYWRQILGQMQIIKNGENFELDPTVKPLNRLTRQQQGANTTIINISQRATDANNPETLADNVQKVAESKSPLERIVSDNSSLLIKTGLATTVIGGVGLYIGIMNIKYRKRQNAKRDDCVKVCAPDPLPAGQDERLWTRDQETAKWSAFELYAATMEPDDPYNPGRHPYCTTNNLETYRTLENNVNAVCDDYCSHNCDEIIVRKGWTNWLGDNAATAIRSAADLAGDAAGTAAAAAAGAAAETAAAAGGSFWDTLGFGQWFAAGAAIICLIILYMMLK